MVITDIGAPSALPTNYEYFQNGVIHSGLLSNGSTFTLNGKEIFIYSGAFHYFRVPRPYWRDRLRKMRAAGLNTVDTFIPWNLHEPVSGQFDFGNANNDMSDFLHLDEFLKTAQEEDLFAIVRPGPHISADWEFGGLPSWLLREDNIEMRTSNAVFMKYVTRFFNALLPILAALQFTKKGPIIALQVENDYSVSQKHDLEYLKQLSELMGNHGVTEFLMTSDNPREGTYGSMPRRFLLTGKFDHHVDVNMEMLKKVNTPNKPLMVMDFYTGWADTWGGNHSERNPGFFKYNYEKILRYPASVNIYMFIGGSNFGFMNGGANLKFDERNTDYRSIPTSYDYMAPVTESGELTAKYYAVKKLLEKYNPVKTSSPPVPEIKKPVAYKTVMIEQQLLLNDLLQHVKPIHSKTVIPMEKLDINNSSGQSYGYVVYRKTEVNLLPDSWILIIGRVCDTAMVLVNGEHKTPYMQNVSNLNDSGSSRVMNTFIVLNNDEFIINATIDIVVENWGRIHLHQYLGFKGLWQGQVRLGKTYLEDWLVYPLEFKTIWTTSLGNFNAFNISNTGPSLYRGYLDVVDTPADTFVHMENWVKGMVAVNGFVVGRYAHMGPVQTIFIPATMLKKGRNTIDVFEHFRPFSGVEFTNKHIYNTYQ